MLHDATWLEVPEEVLHDATSMERGVLEEVLHDAT